RGNEALGARLTVVGALREDQRHALNAEATRRPARECYLHGILAVLLTGVEEALHVGPAQHLAARATLAGDLLGAVAHGERYRTAIGGGSGRPHTSEWEGRRSVGLSFARRVMDPRAASMPAHRIDPRATFHEAMEHVKAGRLRQAADACQRIVRQEPQNAP